MKKYQYIYIVMLYICYNIYAFKCHTHLNSTELIQISTGGMMVDMKGAIPFTQIRKDLQWIFIPAGSAKASEKAVDHLYSTKDELQTAGHQQR